MYRVEPRPKNTKKEITNIVEDWYQLTVGLEQDFNQLRKSEWSIQNLRDRGRDLHLLQVCALIERLLKRKTTRRSDRENNRMQKEYSKRKDTHVFGDGRPAAWYYCDTIDGCHIAPPIYTSGDAQEEEGHRPRKRNHVTVHLIGEVAAIREQMKTEGAVRTINRNVQL